MVRPGNESEHDHVENAKAFGITLRCEECGRIVDEIELADDFKGRIALKILTGQLETGGDRKFPASFSEEEIKERWDSLEEDLEIFKNTLSGDDDQDSGG